MHPTASAQGTYSLEIYYKMNQNNSYSTTQDNIQIMPLLRSNLTNLTVDNFQNNTGLDVDLSDMDSLRNFTSSVHYMQARVRGLPLISFDREDTLTCESWDLTINFDLIGGGGPQVTRDASANQIKCDPSWGNDIDLDGTDDTDKPMQKVVGLFTFRKSSFSTSSHFFVESSSSTLS